MSIRPLNDREVATILHALRKLQDPANCIRCCDHFDEVEPLTDPEIDVLCESINLDSITITIH